MTTKRSLGLRLSAILSRETGLLLRGNSPLEGRLQQTRHQAVCFRERARSASGRWAPYLLVREIGRGGMGVVYEAIDRKLNRRAAVKVLTLNASNDPRLAARFHHEAQIVARLNHPNIVSVYGSGEHEGTHFIAFQLVEGRSLETFLANPPLMDEASEVISGRVTRDRLKQNRSDASEQPATASRVANGSTETTSLTSSSLR